MYNSLNGYLSVPAKTDININDMCSNLDISVLLAKIDVPMSHKKIADNFNTLYNVCRFQIVQPRISNVEKALLTKYSFNTLENTTISTINEEIAKLKEWSLSTDDKLRNDADELFKIRVKELKFMLSTNYVHESDETNKGYKALEVYIKNVSKDNVN